MSIRSSFLICSSPSRFKRLSLSPPQRADLADLSHGVSRAEAKPEKIGVKSA